MSEISLPFQETKQQALIGHMLSHESFFKTVITKIKPEWFVSEKLAKVYRIMHKLYTERAMAPNKHELKNCPDISALEPRESLSLQSYIDLCSSATNVIRLKSIVPELTEWLHSTILIKSLKEAENLYNGRKIKECSIKLYDSMREIQTTSFNSGENESFSDYSSFLKAAKVDREDALSTGLDLLDKAILKDAKSGGLQKGDTTLIMAPVNMRKVNVFDFRSLS